MVFLSNSSKFYFLYGRPIVVYLHFFFVSSLLSLPRLNGQVNKYKLHIKQAPSIFIFRSRLLYLCLYSLQRFGPDGTSILQNYALQCTNAADGYVSTLLINVNVSLHPQAFAVSKGKKVTNMLAVSPKVNFRTTCLA
jgi:hypothetical protein